MSLIQETRNVLENVPDRQIFDKEKALEVFIEGCKPCSFRCGLKAYLCAKPWEKLEKRKTGVKQPNSYSHMTPEKNGPSPSQTLEPTAPKVSQPKKSRARTKKRPCTESTANPFSF